MEDHKELLGLWRAETEGAKFWLGVLTELQNRGVNDVLTACVDGLKGFPEAINTVFPKTQIQLCIVHMIRNSHKFVPWKYYREVTTDLKTIYQNAPSNSLYKLQYWLTSLLMKPAKSTKISCSARKITGQTN